MSQIVAERISAQVNNDELFVEASKLFNQYPSVQRSVAVGGWSLQSTNGTYQDGWSLDFCAYNGPQNRGPSWTPQDEIEKKMSTVQDCVRPTEMTIAPFSQLLQNLESQGLNPRRARIIKLAAGTSSVWHQDGVEKFYQVRLHIPLFTNSGCFFETVNGQYHMASDGAYYFVHINQKHRVVNSGTQDRYHFVCHVWDQKKITQHHQYNVEMNLGETFHPAAV